MTSRIPHAEPFQVGEFELDADDVIDILGHRLTDRRRELIDSVASSRTYTCVPVLDGIYDLGNVAAVMRSAEALGYQALHVIETQEKFKAPNRITQGADKWLDVSRWKEPGPCIELLRERGYRIMATHLDASIPIQDVDFTEPTAIVFGNEHDGVSEHVLEASDQNVILPMQGFSQSLNISVAAAITLWQAREQRIEALGRHGDLSEEDVRLLMAEFYLRSVDRPERLVRGVLNRQS